MCLGSQLLRTGSSGRWLRRKNLWASMSGSSPLPAGPGFRCPSPGTLGHPVPFGPWEPMIEMPRSSPSGLTGAFLGAVPFSARTALAPSPAQCSPRRKVTLLASSGAVDVHRHRRRSPLTLGCSPRLAGSPTGDQQHRRCSQQGSDGSGCSTDGPWGRRAASLGHSEEKRGCGAAPQSCCGGAGWAAGGSREVGSDNRS